MKNKINVLRFYFSKLVDLTSVNHYQEVEESSIYSLDLELQLDYINYMVCAILKSRS